MARASSGRSRAAGSPALRSHHFTGEPPLCYRGTCYEHFHDGLDLAAPIGTPVQAIASGRVTIAGRMSDGAVVVEIEHSPGVLSAVWPSRVRAPCPGAASRCPTGEVIGSVGLTGNTTGPHLHFEIYASGEPIDPLLVLPPTGKPGGSP